MLSTTKWQTNPTSNINKKVKTNMNIQMVNLYDQDRVLTQTVTITMKFA